MDSLHALPRILAVLARGAAGLCGRLRLDGVVVRSRDAARIGSLPARLRVRARYRDRRGRSAAKIRCADILFDQGMRMCDARLAITEHQARLFREQGMSVQRHQIASAGSQAAKNRKGPSISFGFARCNPIKQPQLFLDLAERLPRARCRMICSIQDKPLWEAVSARAATLPNVEFPRARAVPGNPESFQRIAAFREHLAARGCAEYVHSFRARVLRDRVAHRRPRRHVRNV